MQTKKLTPCLRSRWVVFSKQVYASEVISNVAMSSGKVHCIYLYVHSASYLMTNKMSKSQTSFILKYFNYENNITP